MRPNLVGDPSGVGGSAMVDRYFNAAAFPFPPPAPLWKPEPERLPHPDFWQWDLGVVKILALPFREGWACSSAQNFSMC